MTLAKTVHTLVTWIAVAVIGLGLGGCASKSYVVLLDNGDGTVGKVQVTSPKGTTLLEKNREGAIIGDHAGETFAVSDEKIGKDFAAALAASPVKPISFLLYFDVGGAKLTPESEASIPKVLEAIAQRPAADVSVIGHTDTAGVAETNEQLGLTRARFVAELIANAKIESERVAVESHGEKNLLVPTPDNTAEPRNRRVEVTVR